MTSALHAEGPRFDPGLVYFLPQCRARAGGVRARAERRQTGASIAQMVERKTLNLVVVGSIPTGGAPFASILGAWVKLGEDRPAWGLTQSRFSSVGRASD